MKRVFRMTQLDGLSLSLAAAVLLGCWQAVTLHAQVAELQVIQVQAAPADAPLPPPLAGPGDPVVGPPTDAVPAETPGEHAPDNSAEKPSSENNQETEPEPMPAIMTPPQDPDVIKLSLMDGSILTGKLALKELIVETQYGQLNVPVTNIRSFTPGLSSHPALGKQVATWIADLGSANFNDREKAQKGLSKLGPSIRQELEKYQADSDTERKNRVLALLSEFDELAEADAMLGAQDAAWNVQQRDVIETVDFTIVGKIVPQSFAVTSQYGNLTIQLSDIRKAHREQVRKEDIRQNLSIDASHFALKNPLSTPIKLERGDQVFITAEGTLHMQPWGNGASSNPDGNQNYGWFMGNQIPMAALVGRVGNSDQFVKFGSKHNFTAEKAGVLQLAIGMQNDYQESQFPGKYNVKIRVVKKQ